jgi:hypothetical protein
MRKFFCVIQEVTRMAQLWQENVFTYIMYKTIMPAWQVLSFMGGLPRRLKTIM